MVVDKVKSHSKTKHILLVDDVNLMCQFLNETLRVIPNVECHTASRVTTADTILQRYAIDLAIIDLNLPDGSGLDIVKKIRKGGTKEKHIRAGKKVKEAGMELSEYVMPGLGGIEYSVETVKAVYSGELIAIYEIQARL